MNHKTMHIIMLEDKMLLSMFNGNVGHTKVSVTGVKSSKL